MITGTLRIALRGLIIVFAVLAIPSAPGWEWPVNGPFDVTGDDDFAMVFAFEDPALFRLVAPGEEIFSQTGGGDGVGPPRDDTRRIYRHSNDIWSIVEGDPGSGVVRYRLYDALLDRFVNPRVLLPLDPPGPVEALPDLRYRQDGAIRTAAQLAPGSFEIIAPPGGWDSATIPLEISVLLEGRVIANHRFVYAEDIADLLELDGTLGIAAAELRPGVNSIEIQTRRYDGTPRLRRYEIIAGSPVPGP